jgi:tRNA(Ile)-lysidine synthase
MPALFETVKNTLARYSMLTPGGKVVAAVSGGPDSTAMLHVLAELAPELGITLAVAHLDHRFRPESASEALFVSRMADRLGLPCLVEKAGLSGISGNKQAAAREARYAFFERAAEKLSADKIAVGHTADDQAETCLMRVIRGSGVRGGSGIPPVRGASTRFMTRIIRPLIEATRDDVQGYLDSNGIESVTDPTNKKTIYHRNAVRLELMPLLRRYNPGVVEALSRSAEILRAEDEYLSGLTEELMPGLLAEEQAGRLALRLDAFMGLPEAMKRRVIRRAVELIKGDLVSLGYGHVLDAVRSVASGSTGRGHDLPGGVRVERSYDMLLVYRPDEPGGFSAQLPVPGSVLVEAAGITVGSRILGPDEPAPPADGSSALFDMGRLNLPLTVRGRRPGDFFHPLGMSGRKKLQDYFTDIKLPRQARVCAPILDTGGDVAWVMGLRQDKRFVADAYSKKVLLVSFRKTLNGAPPHAPQGPPGP